MRAARCADQLDFADFNEVLASGKALGQIALVTPDGEAREVANELGPVAEVVVVEDLPARRGEDESVLWLLSEVPDERGVEGVDAILVQVCEPDELAELAEDTKNSVPWERWAEKHPEIAAATSKGRFPNRRASGGLRGGCDPAAARWLVERGNRRTRRQHRRQREEQDQAGACTLTGAARGAKRLPSLPARRIPLRRARSLPRPAGGARGTPPRLRSRARDRRRRVAAQPTSRTIDPRANGEAKSSPSRA
jgi:hypothetical protein